jgi:NAD(P)-dependent dehydrogenase (short-subunit alcohol dehydrogenase family)
MTVVVTGASRGIGRALFDLYSARGTPVIGTCRGDPPGRGEWLRLDVTDAEDLEAMAEAVDDRAVELLVCNAGVFLDRGDRLGDYDAAVWAETLAVNVTGVFLTVQALLPALRRGKRPRVAIVTSQLGSSARAAGTAYAYRASKAAAINVGLNLAAELSPRIAVGIYHPGWVRTDMAGGSADISPEESAEGLALRFEELTPETTGAFLTWDGQAHPV